MKQTYSEHKLALIEDNHKEIMEIVLTQLDVREGKVKSDQYAISIEFSKKTAWEAAMQNIKKHSDEVRIFFSSRYIPNKSIYRLAIPTEQFRPFLEILEFVPIEPKTVTVELTIIAGDIQKTPSRKKQKVESTSGTTSQVVYSMFAPQNTQLPVVPVSDSAVIFCDFVLSKWKKDNCSVFESISTDRLLSRLQELWGQVDVSHFRTKAALDSLATTFCAHVEENKTLNRESLLTAIDTELLMDFDAYKVT